MANYYVPCSQIPGYLVEVQYVWHYVVFAITIVSVTLQLNWIKYIRSSNSKDNFYLLPFLMFGSIRL